MYTEFSGHMMCLREALLQTVGHYRATVPDLTKASLAKC